MVNEPSPGPGRRLHPLDLSPCPTLTALLLERGATQLRGAGTLAAALAQRDPAAPHAKSTPLLDGNGLRLLQLLPPAQPHQQQPHDMTRALRVSLLAGHPRTTLVLLQAGVPLPQPKELGGIGALHHAVGNGDLGTAAHLLALRPGGLEERSPLGQTLLHCACAQGQAAAARWLRSRGARAHGAVDVMWVLLVVVVVVLVLVLVFLLLCYY
jgi:ankyrin repeat protein